MEGEDALLTRWCNELEEFSFIIKHRPGKSQGHVDGLSGLPLPEVIAVISAEAELKDKLQEVTDRTKEDPHSRNVINGHAYDPQGRLVQGKKGAKHAMDILHHSAAGHLGTKKLLAKFRERYVASKDRAMAEEIMRNCHGCQVGRDYRHRPIPYPQEASPLTTLGIRWRLTSWGHSHPPVETSSSSPSMTRSRDTIFWCHVQNTPPQRWPRCS